MSWHSLRSSLTTRNSSSQIRIVGLTAARTFLAAIPIFLGNSEQQAKLWIISAFFIWLIFLRERNITRDSSNFYNLMISTDGWTLPPEPGSVKFPAAQWNYSWAVVLMYKTYHWGHGLSLAVEKDLFWIDFQAIKGSSITQYIMILM